MKDTIGVGATARVRIARHILDDVHQALKIVKKLECVRLKQFKHFQQEVSLLQQARTARSSCRRACRPRVALLLRPRPPASLAPPPPFTTVSPPVPPPLTNTRPPSPRALSCFPRARFLVAAGYRAAFAQHLGQFQDPHKCYLVFEYVAGGDLYHHLRKAPRGFPAAQAKFHAAQLALALEHMCETASRNAKRERGRARADDAEPPPRSTLSSPDGPRAGTSGTSRTAASSRALLTGRTTVGAIEAGREGRAAMGVGGDDEEAQDAAAVAEARRLAAEIPGGHLKLCDFGFAKHLPPDGARSTAPGSGSPKRPGSPDRARRRRRGRRRRRRRVARVVGRVARVRVGRAGAHAHAVRRPRVSRARGARARARARTHGGARANTRTRGASRGRRR